jgi:hypothetical protein
MFIYSLLSLLLCAPPIIKEETSNKSAAIELPAEIVVNGDEGFVTVEAKCKGKVKWMVVSTDKVRYIENEINNSMIVAVPRTGKVTIFAVGLVDGQLTDFAATRIVVQDKVEKNTDKTKKPSEFDKELLNYKIRWK